ncbi:hypothetical protein VNO77_43120 [Canavalia gladiata]|uniref:Disease resistance N-terminal domain-containing protein n=1 Tax=Canavalia gladiata TaxID=3824 RepID=A0AAN9JVW8_CANGL
MAEAVAGAFLSASVQSLIETITSLQFRDFFRKIRKLNVSLLDELETTLLTLQAVLNDAEQKQIRNPAVKEWLERLKDAVHDAEDLLDEVNTEALRHKVEAQHTDQTIGGKVRNLLCLCQYHGGVNSRLEALCQRLQRFAAQKNGLGLQLVGTRVLARAPTSSVANESGVVGRDDHKGKLMIVSGRSCNRSESCEVSENVRYFSYSRGKYDSSTKFKSCYGAKCLRVFLPLPLSDDPTLWWYWKYYLTKKLETSTSHWITSTKSLTIIDGGQHLLPILETNSQCLLSSIKIEKSDILTSFPRMVLNSNCLRDLSLTKIPSLTSFPTESMQTLRTLLVSECKNLEFPPDEAWKNYSSLENLMIWDSCDSLVCFPLGCFPVLKYLYIWNSPNLNSLSISDYEASSHSLSCLEILRISSCPNLEFFPQQGLSTLNLMELKIINCGKLRSLPEHMYTLNALQDLEISNIPQLVSFPHGGLPTNLRSVYIGFCKGLSLVAIAEYGFQWLTSLLKFGIGGDDLVLAFLEGNALQHLSSLEEFHILRCPRLESLPEERLPSSLSFLRIQDCPLLESSLSNEEEGKALNSVCVAQVVKAMEYMTNTESFMTLFMASLLTLLTTTVNDCAVNTTTSTSDSFMGYEYDLLLIWLQRNSSEHNFLC